MHYRQFCPVSKAAEVFAERWTPLILRELCFGPKMFGELVFANPLISRTVLSQRLKELIHAGVVQVEAKEKGKGSVYRLSQAGEDFRPIIELMGEWGQRWARGRVAPEDLDPELLVWGLARQINPEVTPPHRFVIQFEFRAVPKSCSRQRYWWLVLHDGTFDVCLKNPGLDSDVVIAAELAAFTKAWLGFVSVEEMMKTGRIAFRGDARAVSQVRRTLRLENHTDVRPMHYAAFDQAGAADLT